MSDLTIFAASAAIVAGAFIAALLFCAMIWRFSDWRSGKWIILASILAIAAPADASPYSQAKRYLGMHERTHNKALRRTLGINPARVPWCGYFAAHVVRRAGMKPPKGFPAARSWRKFGKAVRLSSARKGDIVVIRSRRWHVGIYSHMSKGRVCLLGGNQSNRVKVSCYRRGSVNSVRRAGSVARKAKKPTKPKIVPVAYREDWR